MKSHAIWVSIKSKFLGQNLGQNKAFKFILNNTCLWGPTAYSTIFQQIEQLIFRLPQGQLFAWVETNTQTIYTETIHIHKQTRVCVCVCVKCFNTSLSVLINCWCSCLITYNIVSSFLALHPYNRLQFIYRILFLNVNCTSIWDLILTKERDGIQLDSIRCFDASIIVHYYYYN